MTQSQLMLLACVLMQTVLPSCKTITPLDAGYRAVAGAAKQTNKNQRPEVVEAAPQDHERRLKEFLDRGAWLVGSSELRSTESPSHDEIRIFAIARKADVAVLSKKLIGTSVNFQQIPLKGERIVTRGNGASSATTRTSLGYRERQAGVFLSRITLLRCASPQPLPVPKPTTASVPASPESERKPVAIKSPTTQKVNETTETTKTIEIIETITPKLKGD